MCGVCLFCIRRDLWAKRDRKFFVCKKSVGTAVWNNFVKRRKPADKRLLLKCRRRSSDLGYDSPRSFRPARRILRKTLRKIRSFLGRHGLDVRGKLFYLLRRRTADPRGAFRARDRKGRLARPFPSYGFEGTVLQYVGLRLRERRLVPGDHGPGIPRNGREERRRLLRNCRRLFLSGSIRFFPLL